MLIPYPHAPVLRAVRTALGLSQADMASYFRVNQSSYTRWERGQIQPPPGIQGELEALVEGFMRDVHAIRSGQPLPADCSYRKAAEFWAWQDELVL